MRGEGEGERDERRGEEGGREGETGPGGAFPSSISLPPLSSWPRAEPCLGAAAGMSPLPAPGFWDPGVCMRVAQVTAAPTECSPPWGCNVLLQAPTGALLAPPSHLTLMRCQAGSPRLSKCFPPPTPLNHCGLEPESWLGRRRRRRESYCSPELPEAKAVMLPGGGGEPGRGAWTLAGGGGARAKSRV